MTVLLTGNRQEKWIIHTPRLFREIVRGSGMDIYRIPLQILAVIWPALESASELNDPQLNALMCRLTVYEIADPECSGYDQKRCDEVYSKAENALPKKGK